MTPIKAFDGSGVTLGVGDVDDSPGIGWTKTSFGDYRGVVPASSKLKKANGYAAPCAAYFRYIAPGGEEDPASSGQTTDPGYIANGTYPVHIAMSAHHSDESGEQLSRETRSITDELHEHICHRGLESNNTLRHYWGMPINLTTTASW